MSVCAKTKKLGLHITRAAKNLGFKKFLGFWVLKVFLGFKKFWDFLLVRRPNAIEKYDPKAHKTLYRPTYLRQISSERRTACNK